MRILGILYLILGLAVLAYAQTAVLSGTVYDANGAVIIGAKITALDEKLKKFEAVTNYAGIFKLNLPFKQYDSTGEFRISKYTLKVEAKHFETVEIKDFRIVPSYKGQMNIDFALDVQPIIDVIKVDSSKNKTKRKNNKQ